MGRLTELLTTAQNRAKTGNLSYEGALEPHEAAELWQIAPGAQLIDVRSHAERDLVGSIPGAMHVEWMSYPGWHLNPHFLAQLKQIADPGSLALFICRNGQRSHRAAEFATINGYLDCYNVLEGFEGDLLNGHRGGLNGWKFRGLPWEQR